MEDKNKIKQEINYKMRTIKTQNHDKFDFVNFIKADGRQEGEVLTENIRFYGRGTTDSSVEVFSLGKVELVQTCRPATVLKVTALQTGAFC